MALAFAISSTCRPSSGSPLSRIASATWASIATRMHDDTWNWKCPTNNLISTPKTQPRQPTPTHAQAVPARRRGPFEGGRELSGRCECCSDRLGRRQRRRGSRVERGDIDIRVEDGVDRGREECEQCFEFVLAGHGVCLSGREKSSRQALVSRRGSVLTPGCCFSVAAAAARAEARPGNAHAWDVGARAVIAPYSNAEAGSEGEI